MLMLSCWLPRTKGLAEIAEGLAAANLHPQAGLNVQGNTVPAQQQFPPMCYSDAVIMCLVAGKATVFSFSNEEYSLSRLWGAIAVPCSLQCLIKHATAGPHPATVDAAQARPHKAAGDVSLLQDKHAGLSTPKIVL